MTQAEMILEHKKTKGVIARYQKFIDSQEACLRNLEKYCNHLDAEGESMITSAAYVGSYCALCGRSPHA